MIALNTALGCDSIIITTLTVLPNSTNSIAVEICEGDEYFVGGTMQTTSGIYQDTLVSWNGCDSVLTTTLTVVEGFDQNIIATICEGDSILLAGSYQVIAGDYIDSLLSTSGCDSVITTTLIVNQEYEIENTVSICEGDSILLGGDYQMLGGIFQDSLQSISGCDSVITTTLTVNPNEETNISITICEGEIYYAAGANQTTTGIYYDSLNTTLGCDSIIITTLTVLPNSTNSIAVEICEGDEYFVGGTMQTTSGIYQDTLVSWNGCDSVLTTTLTVVEGFDQSIIATICEGDSILLAGSYQVIAGDYIDSLLSTSGCDSVITTTLIVNQEYEIENTVSICEGDSILLGGDYQMLGGIFQDSLQSISGCDSVITTTLTVNPNEETNISITICEGEIYYAAGANQTTTGIYYDSLNTTLGCDSVIITTLTVLPNSTNSIAVEICEGDEYFVGGTMQTTSGIYQDTLVSWNGCDSVLTTTLTVVEGFDQSIIATICEGDSILLAGSYQVIAGDYIDSLLSTSGCDSVITTTLIVNQEYEIENTVSICEGDSILLGGDYQMLGGIFQDSLQSISGCDSVITTTLTVNPNEETNISITICEGEIYYAAGANQTTTGIYYDSLNTTLGCDSIIITTLTVLPNSTNSIAVEICEGDEYFVGGTMQTTSGIYQDTLVSWNGCDSVLTTTLTVVEGFDQSIIATICEGDSILLAGSYQVIAGDYIDSLLSTSGCDSVITTTLIVNQEYEIENTVSICEGDSILLGGDYQMLGGIFQDSLQSISGCDSVITTTLTVNPNEETNISITICEGEIYYAAGANQTTTGIYYDSLNTTLGCDSVIITTLTVLPNSTNSIAVEICEGDEYFVGGTMQTTSGIYQDTLVSWNGCDSVLTTTLTVVEGFDQSIIATICEGDSILLAGSYQVIAGDYIDSLLSTSGCDSVITTTLIVNQEYEIENTVSICEGDSILLGGDYQMLGGIFQDSLQSISGCDSVITTTLTVNPNEETNISITICEGEIYYAAGANQTTTGIYYDSLNTTLGCDSVIITTLTVLPNSTNSIAVEICEGDEYFVGGTMQTTSGIYQDTLVSWNGCDSVLTTTLTVVEGFDQSIIATICEGDSILLAGSYQVIAGDYIDSLLSTSGCDSVITTTLIVNQEYEIENTVSICEGDSILLGGDYQMLGGIFQDSLQSISGCDSVITTTLTVNPNEETNISITICEGEIYYAAGANQTTTGIYYDSLNTTLGCDSVIITTLTVLPNSTNSIAVEICEGDEYFVGGTMQTTSGIYQDTLVSWNGCDSVLTTTLTVAAGFDQSNIATICEGDSILLAGSYQVIAGDYIDSLLSTSGCDSVITTTLIVNQEYEIENTVSICEGDSILLGGDLSDVRRNFPRFLAINLWL